MKIQLYDRGFTTQSMFRYIVRVKRKPFFLNCWEIVYRTDDKYAAMDVYSSINTPQVILEKIV